MMTRRYAGLLCGLVVSICVASVADALVVSIEEAIDLALRNNETILEARQKVSRAESQLLLSQADRYLQVNFDGNYTQSDLGDKKGKDYDYRIGLSQIIKRFGAVPGYLDQVQESLRQALIEYEKTRQEIVFQVRLTYRNILLTQEEIQERRQLEDELQKKLTRTQSREAEDLVIRLNVLGAELDLMEQQLELNQLSRRLETDKAELVRLMGADPMEPITVVEIKDDWEITLEEAIEKANENRTELLDLEGQIERQKRLLRETKWRHVPELNAYYTYKDFGIDLAQKDQTWDLSAKYDPSLMNKGDMFSLQDRDGWKLGFRLSLPIFNGSRVARQHEIEEAELERLKYELAGARKQIAVEIMRKLKEISNSKERVSLEQKRLEVESERLRVVETILESAHRPRQYESLTYDDVIEVRRQHANAQRSYYQARRDYVKNQEELRRAMGMTE